MIYLECPDCMLKIHNFTIETNLISFKLYNYLFFLILSELKELDLLSYIQKSKNIVLIHE